MFLLTISVNVHKIADSSKTTTSGEKKSTTLSLNELPLTYSHTCNNNKCVHSMSFDDIINTDLMRVLMRRFDQYKNVKLNDCKNIYFFFSFT